MPRPLRNVRYHWNLTETPKERNVYGRVLLAGAGGFPAPVASEQLRSGGQS